MSAHQSHRLVLYHKQLLSTLSDFFVLHISAHAGLAETVVIQLSVNQESPRESPRGIQVKVLSNLICKYGGPNPTPRGVVNPRGVKGGFPINTG